MILLGPLAVLLLIVASVRGRRSSANVALLAPLLALAGLFLAGWAEFRKTIPYDAKYEWLNVATAFSGPARFQTYIVDIGIRVSHLTTILMLSALVLSVALLAWSRAGSRGEPSPARYYGLLTLLLAAALGVVASTDLSELYVFWGLGAVASYLLLSSNWTDQPSTLAGRLALAVPAVSDLALLAGIALLYSVYGQLDIDQLIVQVPVIGHFPKALATASVLLVVGAAGRLGLFPFHGWLTGASTTPTGALAAAQGFGAVMAAGLLFKVMPILVQANSVPTRTIAVLGAVSAVALPLIGLATLDARKAVVASGIAISALAVLAFSRPGGVAPAAILLAASGVARAGATLAAGTLVAGLRTALLSEMGEGFRRMRLTVLALPLAALALVIGVGQVAGGKLAWFWALAYGLGLGLAALGLLRVYFLAGHGLPPRRRGFDPNRVRAAPGPMAWPPLVLGLVALVMGVGLYSGRALGYADHLVHFRTSLEVAVIWLAIPVAGALLAAVLFLWSRPLGTRLTGSAAALWDRGEVLGAGVVARFLVTPALELAGVVEDAALAGGEERLGRSVERTSWFTRRRWPVLPILAGVAVLVAAVAALAAPGVYR